MIRVTLAALAVFFTWCLLFGRMPLPLLISLCAAVGLILVCFGKHSHSHFLSIDVMAQGSRLRHVSPTLKFWTALILIVVCVASRNVATGVFLVAVMFVLVVIVGGLDFREYIHFLMLPVSFLLVAGIAILFDVSAEPAGVLKFPFFGLWLTVSDYSQARTTLIVSRAFGAVSCLCSLSLTTPMPEITGVLRRAGCPDVMIDLMYLIYRYLFILLAIHNDMYTAAGSRLGFRDYRTSIQSTGKIYSNLLVRGYRFAAVNFDAMESRCYDSGIRFLERGKRVAAGQAWFAGLIVSTAIGVSLLPM